MQSHAFCTHDSPTDTSRSGHNDGIVEGPFSIAVTVSLVDGAHRFGNGPY